MLAAEELLVRNGESLVLADHQKEVLTTLWSGVRFPMSLIARGGGGTLIHAVYFVLQAILFENQHLGAITTYERQADVFFEEVIRFYTESPALQSASKELPGRTGAYRVWKVTSTDSVLKVIPTYEHGGLLLGQRFTKIFVDQFINMPYAAWKSVIVKSLDAGEPQLALLSVASRRSDWAYKVYSRYKQAVESGSGDYALLEYSVDDLNGFYDPEAVELIREKVRPEVYDMEYKLKLI